MRDGSRAARGRWWAVLAGMTAVLVLGLADLARPRLIVVPEEFLPRRSATDGATAMGRPESPDRSWSAVYGTTERPYLPARAADPRLIPLRHAGETWRAAAGPRRVVVDQLCLVPDVPTFLEAIATWDEGHSFPILIDEPARVLPYLPRLPAGAGGPLRKAPEGPAQPGPGPVPSPESERLDRWVRASAPCRSPGRRRRRPMIGSRRAARRLAGWAGHRRASCSARPTARCSPGPWRWRRADSSRWSGLSQRSGGSILPAGRARRWSMTRSSRSNRPGGSPAGSRGASGASSRTTPGWATIATS